MAELEIKNLCFSYGEKSVLKNLSLSLPQGGRLLLLGESGRGKTTLLRLILGFLRPDKGEIKGLDKNENVAVLYQEDRLFPQLTVYKNLKLVKKDLSREAAAELLSELRLGKDVLDKLPGELSGGMRRRAALARCLIFDAGLILLDEPFQGLDQESRRAAQAAINKYSAGRTLLVISHQAEDGPALGAELLRLESITEGSGTNE